MAKAVKMFGKFKRDSRGNVALAFGIMLVPVVGASGAAIDLQYASNARSVLQAEVDAAALEVMKATVEIQTSPANASKPQSELSALVEAKSAQILTARRAVAETRLSSSRVTNVALVGAWANLARTEYKFTATADVKRYIRVSGIGGTDPSKAVLASATAKMEVQTTTLTPSLANPGYEAGDYNRIYAYCYNDAKKNEADKGRSQMTPVSSNGTDGGSGPAELNTNPAFMSIVMPVCGPGETLSWRLYNVRDQRTNKKKWPSDHWNATTKLWEQTDKGGVTIYNHYSDTKIDSGTGMEQYAFTGAAFGLNQPIRMMETVVCDTMDKCTPGKPGAMTPSGKNRNPVQQNAACEPGKFMYIGWEDRPFLPKNAALNDYSSGNSQQWTDSDYDDITLVISCPQFKYTKKIFLIK